MAIAPGCSPGDLWSTKARVLHVPPLKGFKMGYVYYYCAQAFIHGAKFMTAGLIESDEQMNKDLYDRIMDIALDDLQKGAPELEIKQMLITSMSLVSCPAFKGDKS